jgi:hypothetical protein
MSAATNAERTPPTSAELDVELRGNDAQRAELESQRAELGTRLARLKRQRGEAIAGGRDASTLTREIREAGDELEGIESALGVLAEQRATLEKRHSDAKLGEAVNTAAAKREAYAAAVREAHDTLHAFLRDTFAPLDARLTALGTAANKAEYAALSAAGRQATGMSAAEKVIIDHRRERAKAGDTRHWLPKLLMDLREIARAARVDTTPDHS